MYKRQGTNTARTELLIFLTPRVIYGDADSELIKQVEAERMHFLESEAEELHGPLYSVPPSGVDEYSPVIEPEIMLPGTPIPVESYSLPPADGSVILPPQAKANRTAVDRDSSREIALQKFATAKQSGGDVVRTSGTDLDPRVYQALAESAAKQDEARARNEKAAAADWVRNTIEKKNAQREQVAPKVRLPEQANVSATKARPVIQPRKKTVNPTAIRTLSAAEAGIDDKKLAGETEPKPSWLGRLRW